MKTPDNVGNLQQLGGTRLVTLGDGVERGVRAVEFRTTTGLEFGVLVDRAMDVSWCRYKGRSVAWHSPVGLIGPWYRETTGLGFLRSFQGGLTVTCGLDHILFPQVDPHDTYNYPGRQSTEYGLHGRIASTPAMLRRYGEVEVDGDWELEAVGEVVQAGALAENLVLTRRVSCRLNGRAITIEDQIENRGHYATPHMFLYHINLGAPLLDASCELVAPIRKVLFRTPTASGDERAHLQFHGPQAGFVEQAFEHSMVSSQDGRVRLALINRADQSTPWGLLLDYDGKAFGHFFQWRYFDAGTYVLGIEPSTNSLISRQDARDAGALIMLEPGQKRSYRTRFEFLEGQAECERERASIQRVAKSGDNA